MSGRTEESLQKFMTKKGKTKNIVCFLVCGDMAVIHTLLDS
jgi:hypothetical protein